MRAGDTLYDLGCGDGRIVLGAAKRGARATRIGIDPIPLNFARAYARRAGAEVEQQARFVRAGDQTLYLWIVYARKPGSGPAA